jgi:serine/threonine protein kinase/tetratricopeptide (TPR) repeat protein
VSLVFGKYEKIKKLAQGGMGEVFLARQTGVLDRLAILKALRPDLAKEKEFVDQFLDEARVAATLNHPNIVAIFDVGEWGGTYFIAMEYIAGEDLSKLWYAAAKAGVGLPFQVSVRIVMEAGLGLDHAHRAKDVRGVPLNIVHRDISPQNIMVRADGVTKLVDFGIAKAANKSSRTQAGMVKGKLQYMSPEQVRGEHLDGRSDQFSLGIVLWEMCTGRRLFKADSEIKTLQKILQDPIPKPSQHVPGFPAELEAVIMRMLERDPAKRFATLSDVSQRLKEYVDRASVSSGEVSVAQFVQQILGKELEERTRDLTPMEPTEAGAPVPAPPAKPSSSRAASILAEPRGATGEKPAARETSGLRGAPPLSSKESSSRPQARPMRGQLADDDDKDPPTVVVPDRERPDQGRLRDDRDDGDDELGALFPSGGAPARAELVVKKTDGSAVHFQEWATLQQWVLDGKLTADDQLQEAGRPFVPLGRDPRLTASFAAAQATAKAKTAALTTTTATPPPLLPQEPVQKTAARASFDPETLPLGEAVVEPPQSLPPSASSSSSNAALAAQNDPFGAPAGGVGAPTAAYSIGSLPQAATGQWQIGAQSQAALAATVDGTTPPSLSSTPALTTPPAPLSAKKVPTVLWALMGALATFVVLAVIIRVAAPEMFAALRDGDTPAFHQASAALTATKTDEPATLTAVLTNLGPALAADDGNVDAHVAAAFVELERWRVLQAAAILEKAAQAQKLSTSTSDPAPALAGAQKHAAQAQAAAAAVEPKKTWAAVVAALVDAAAAADASSERGHLDRALTLAADVPELADEVKVAQALAAALIGVNDPTRAQDASDVNDKRLATLKLLTDVVRASAKKEADKEPARAAVDARLKKSPSDPRFLAARALLGEAPAAPTDPKTDPKAIVDAGVVAAVVKDAGVAAPVAVVDAGVVVVAETYESALAKAQTAAKKGRSGEAGKMFKLALQKKPADNIAELGLAWAQIDLGKTDSAAKSFRNVLNRDPSLAEAQYGLGEALRATGKTTEAIEAFQKYLEMAPNGPDAETAKNAIRSLE